MFRAAFPTASDESERIESNWVKANFDNTGGNRAGKARFAGTWVTAEVATNMANDYSLEKIIPPLTDAKPDPSTEYRKSSRAQQQQQQTPDKEPPPPKQLPTPSPSTSTPNPPKRRRDASPAPSVAASSPTKSPLSPVATRRSQRTTSPAPAPAPKLVSPKVAASTVKSPLKVLRSPVRTRRLEVVTPAGSDETAVDDDVPEVAGPDATEDIQEQKEMIEAFKAQREAKLRAQAASDADEAMDEGERKREREQEDASLQFDFKEPETQERKIATNRRIARLPEMTPERRSFAWGVAAFAAAVGAM